MKNEKTKRKGMEYFKILLCMFIFNIISIPLFALVHIGAKDTGKSHTSGWILVQHYRANPIIIILIIAIYIILFTIFYNKVIIKQITDKKSSIIIYKLILLFSFVEGLIIIFPSLFANWSIVNDDWIFMSVIIYTIVYPQIACPLLKERNFTKDEIKNDVYMATLAYVFPLIPLFKKEKSEFIKLHLKNGIVLYIQLIVTCFIYLLAASVKYIDDSLLLTIFVCIIICVIFIDAIGIKNVRQGKYREMFPYKKILVILLIIIALIIIVLINL